MSNHPGTTHTLLRFIQILVRNKVMIFLVTFVPTVCAIVLVLVVDSTYKSMAVVNPPSSKSGGGLESAFKDGGMGGIGLLSSVLGGNESGLNDCLTILESARLGRMVINRFDLETVYEFKKEGDSEKYFYADVLKQYHRNVGYEITDEKALRIWAKSKSPDTAKLMVDYVVYALDSLYTEIQLANARNRLRHSDIRLDRAEAEMEAIEDSLVAFQLRHNLLVPQAQVRAVMENALQTEIRLETLREELALEKALRGTRSARYQDLETQIALTQKALERQMNQGSDMDRLILPANSLPGVVTDYFRLERAYTIKLGVFKYLVQEVEMLKLSADKEFGAISVVDSAWVNDKRVSPKRRATVQVVFVLSFLLGTSIAVVRAFWRQHSENNPDSRSIMTDIRRNLFRLRRRDAAT